ncbi:MAG: tetratricopeptide repeat protein [Bacteroidales bacterium]|nr:tetratricopeptide repeat protein [Bacteroidales bacterium]
MKITLLILFIISATTSFAQNEVDEKLALQFYQNKEYDKAAELYQRIYNEDPSPFYYDYLINCFFELHEYKKARKFVASVVRNNPNEIKYKVEEAYVYQRWGKSKIANKEYNKLIKKYDNNRNEVIELSHAFAARNLDDYAIKALKNNSFKPPLNIELAQIYYKVGNYPEMINQYLDIVLLDEKYLNLIKGKLQLIITDPTKENVSEALREELIKRTEKRNSEIVFSELLYWFSIQKKNFNLALIQAKALDNRFDEQGERVFKLANILMNNKEWSLAVEAYNYLISNGPESIYYMNSEIMILEAKFNIIISNMDYVQQDIIDLQDDYKIQLNAFGKNATTVTMMMNLAHIQAYYLDDLESAKVLLTEIQGISNVPKQRKAKAKLQLGDIKLFSGEKWSASLLYKQVEKENKQEPIGYLAKFKAAQFYYYVGEMEWAKSQLDVLRGATSKLIANNSMELYLLIQENISPDSSYDALDMYSDADLLHYQRKYSLANNKLDTILNIFPQHVITDNVYFKKARIAMDQKEYSKADSLYELTVDYAPFGPLADNALIERARLNDFIIKRSEVSLDLYQKILLDYPGSLFTIEARKRYREKKENN